MPKSGSDYPCIALRTYGMKTMLRLNVAATRTIIPLTAALAFSKLLTAKASATASASTTMFT